VKCELVTGLTYCGGLVSRLARSATGNACPVCSSPMPSGGKSGRGLPISKTLARGIVGAASEGLTEQGGGASRGGIGRHSLRDDLRGGGFRAVIGLFAKVF
jgi:hypothetical protein